MSKQSNYDPYPNDTALATFIIEFAGALCWCVFEVIRLIFVALLIPFGFVFTDKER